MSSAGLCAALACRAWWGPDRRASAAHNLFGGGSGSQSGEPAEQSGVLVPFGQVVGDDVGVGGFEGFAFGLSGGASVNLGGGQVGVSEDVADVGQRHACLAEVHGLAVAQYVRAEVGAEECRVAGLGLVFADDPGDPAAAELAPVLVDEQRAVVAAGLVEAV